jgi:pyrroloquinoline quinone biosynthesis protein B
VFQIVVLGSAAGGGFPQWNCNTEACRSARAGDALVRTQSSIAVSGDGKNWFLFNASPDLRQQINANPQLHPNHGLRSSPIAGVILTNADVDHVAGLLTIRESTPLVLYATERVLATLKANSIFNVLNPEFVQRSAIVLGEAFEPMTPAGENSGLIIEPFAVPGKVALYMEDSGAGDNFGTQQGDTVGVRVTSTESGEYFFYIPGCADVPPELESRLAGASLVLFDGTLWQDNEMIDAGIGVKTGKRMGHISMSGDDGSIAAFKDLSIGRKIFIHINNSNPTLLDGTPERREVEAQGWEISYDGMEISL